MQNTIYLHNAMQALPDFTFPGIESYASRSLTNRGGVAVVATPQAGGESARTPLAYYHSLNMGVDSILEVPVGSDGDLYPAILGSPSVVRDIQNLVLVQNHRVQFFNTRSEIEERFFQRIGLRWRHHSLSIPSAVADAGNSKATVRRIAGRIGKPKLFPAHVVVSGTTKNITEAFFAMDGLTNDVVLKRASWASGLGMVFGKGTETLERFLNGCNTYPGEVIVERSLGTHISMTIVKRFEEGKVTDWWVTEQWCPLSNGTIAHQGSVLGKLPNVSVNDVRWMNGSTAHLYRYFLKRNPKLTGVINWDCAREVSSGKRFVLEGNFRVTFSTYLREIQLSLARQRRVHPSRVTCVMKKVQPERARSFVSLERELGNLMLTNPFGSGVIPIVTACLKRGGYCYLVSIGSSFVEANEKLRQALERLEK